MGIHTGQLYCRLIGDLVKRFDIIGEDVIIANKIEANSQQNKVLVSEDTLNLIGTHDSKLLNKF